MHVDEKDNLFKGLAYCSSRYGDLLLRLKLSRSMQVFFDLTNNSLAEPSMGSASLLPDPVPVSAIAILLAP